MIPNKVYIKGFKRFNDTSILLDRKLLALVGANEAGKSSFFEVLLSVETNTPFNKFQLTKGSNIENQPEHIVVEIEYLLDKKDLDKINEYNGVGSPKYYFIKKQVNGKLIHGLKNGNVDRNFETKDQLLFIIDNLITGKSFSKFLDKNYFIEEEHIEFDGSQTFRSLFKAFKEDLQNNDIDSNGEMLQSLLEKKLKYETSSIRSKLESIKELISSLTITLYEDDPHERFLEYLF